MKIVTAFISDRGEKYLPECFESYEKHVDLWTKFHVIDDREHKLGMAGAVRAAWEWALETDADYLFHVEEDFTFASRVDLAGMVKILEKRPHLAQIALKRQPWSNEEKAAGGFMELDPNAYEDFFTTSGEQWIEHRKLFTLNPCLIPRRTLEAIDPTGGPGGAERTITDACLARGWSFAYYGNRNDPPRCTHVGQDRAGDGWRW